MRQGRNDDFRFAGVLGMGGLPIVGFRVRDD
jgi:hypothetical protein